MAKYALHLLILCSLLPVVVKAIPNGVVGCGAGKEALFFNDNVHATLTQVGGGPLSDFNITMTLNDQVLDPSLETDFETQKDHNLTLIAEGSEFAGFLIRMESPDGIRTIDSILPVETLDPSTNETSTMGAKVASICKQAYFVAGVCHDSPIRKTSVKLNLNMGSAAQDLVMDVSVVVQASISQNISHWYFSNYTLNAISGALDTYFPTQSPTATLSEAPGAPSISEAPKRKTTPWLHISSALIVVLAPLWP